MHYSLPTPEELRRITLRLLSRPISLDTQANKVDVFDLVILFTPRIERN
jgi:hypothetical protein